MDNRVQGWFFLFPGLPFAHEGSRAPILGSVLFSVIQEKPRHFLPASLGEKHTIFLPMSRLHSLSLSAFLGVLLSLSLSLWGNQNRITNPEFQEEGSQKGIPAGWFYDSPEFVKSAYALVQDGEGKAFSIQRVEPGEGLCRISSFVNGLRPEANYLLSFQVKNAAAAQVLVYEFTADDKNVAYSVPLDRKNPEWQTVSFPITLRPDTRRFKLSLMAVKAGETVLYRRMSLLCVDEAPRLTLVNLPKAPALAAQWEDPAWEIAPSTTAYFLLGEKLASSRQAPTFSRLAVSEGALQVITLGVEPDMEGRVTDKEDKWSNDTLEIFLRDPATRVTYHLGLTATGEQCSEVVNLERISGFARNWYSADTTTTTLADVKPLEFQSAIAQRPDGWIAHFSIPLAQQDLEKRTELQVLLARGRKVGRTEEYSSWGRTTGDFFKDSQGFASLSFPPSPANFLPGETIEAQPAPGPATDIIPTPQEAAWGTGIRSFPLGLSVYSAEEKAFLALRQMYLAQFHQEIIRAASPEEADVVLEMDGSWGAPEFDGLQEWQVREAYSLAIGEKARILARSHRGLVNGMASLCQLLAPQEEGRVACREGRVLDWPDLEYRGWHCLSPATDGEVPITLQFIDTLAALKYNWFSLQFDGRFAYERHPELASGNATSKEGHRKIAERLSLYGIEVIPMTQLLSHFRDFLRKPELRRFAENQHPEKETRHTYWNYCPRHPEIHDFVFDMIDEHLECYPEAKWYHVGMDEVTFEPFGICERCKDTPAGDLFAEEALRLYQYVTQVKGRRMAMWCDQLEVQRNGGVKPYNTATALPKIPRDVVIFDWHYTETTNNPTVKFFMDEGFQVIPCGWFYPENIYPLAEEAHRQKALGFGGTSWVLMSSIRGSSALMTSVVLGAERSWSLKGPKLETMAYIPTERFIRLHDGVSTAFPRRYRMLDLSAHYNMALAGDSRDSWMGLGTESDCSALPTGLQWLKGTPFRISQGRRGAVATADDSLAMAKYPRLVTGIPVSGTAKELLFLQTATRPTEVDRTLGRVGEKPMMASYIVHYADGKSQVIPLAWGETLTHWNAQLPSAFAIPAWQGQTPEGARLALETLRWVNPRPEVPIVSLDIQSMEGNPAPVVLAITAVEE